MSDGVWLGILAAATTVYGIYSNNRLRKMELRLKEREIIDNDCKRQLMELKEQVAAIEEDRDKAIKLAIEQYQNKHL